ncbi:MAG: DUF6382 domain-containing protein, partial [Lachnospiraceae bacterium]|nr:DUF6382 domain-containing protein [Lachnospiraceae bacterium]
IRGACEEVDRYLLDIRRLCLDPDLIFYGYAQGRYCFLYNISTEADDSLAGIGVFMDYLLERVSPDDNEASDLVYRMYEVYEKAGFDVWDAVLLAEEKRPEAKDVQPDSYVDTEPGYDTVYDSVYEGLEHMDESVSEEDSATVGCNRRRTAVISIILTALGLAGVAACVAIYFFIYLDEDELMLLIAGGGVAVVVFIAGIILLVRSKILSSREIREGERIYADDDLYAAEHYSAMPVIHMEEFVSQPKPRARRQADRPDIGDKNAGTCDQDNLSDAGQTVFFDERVDSGSYKLYAMDRKNKQHIELDSFPCTIGKFKGYVDCCIDHPSISRMHARIEKHDGVLLLKDTNSTNGTCINGIRLAPNEQRIIEVGDEIRFGSLNYCLRSVGTDLS